jgi:hypothetical protein
MRSAFRLLPVAVICLAAIDPAAPLLATGITQADAAMLAELNAAARGSDYGAYQLLLDRLERRSNQIHGDRLLAIYRDIDRIWTFSRSDRIGAFLSASNAPALLRRLRRYEGFERAIDPYVIESNGARFYPAAEARAFLADKARALAARTPEETAMEKQPPAVHREAREEAKRVIPRPAQSAKTKSAANAEVSSKQAPPEPVLVTPEAPAVVLKETAAQPNEPSITTTAPPTATPQQIVESTVAAPPPNILPPAVPKPLISQSRARSARPTARKMLPADSALLPVVGALNDPKKTAKLSILLGLSVVSLAALSLLIRASRPERLLLTAGDGQVMSTGRTSTSAATGKGASDQRINPIELGRPRRPPL